MNSPYGVHSQADPLARCFLWPLRGLLLTVYRSKLLKVELVVVLFMLGRHFYNPLYQQYYYHVYGAEILENTSFVFPNGSFCLSSDVIDNYTGSNNSYKLDEAFSDHLVAYGQLAATVPAMLVTLALGPLMDRYGQRIGLILPAIGTTLQGIFTLFIIKYSLDPYYFILANFIGGLFGNFTAILASSFSYIADISSVRWRSLRVGLVESALALGSASGTLLIGYWLHHIHCDSIPPLWLYIGCNLFIVPYTLLFVPESLTWRERGDLLVKTPRGIRAFLGGLRLYFGGLSLPSTWKLYVTTLVTVVAVLNIYGGSLIEVYFLKAEPFDFNPLQVGIYQSLRGYSQSISSLILVTLLVIFSVSDVWIMLIAIIFHCTCLMLLGFSTAAWELYTSKLQLILH